MSTARIAQTFIHIVRTHSSSIAWSAHTLKIVHQVQALGVVVARIGFTVILVETAVITDVAKRARTAPCANRIIASASVPTRRRITISFVYRASPAVPIFHTITRKSIRFVVQCVQNFVIFEVFGVKFHFDFSKLPFRLGLLARFINFSLTRSINFDSWTNVFERTVTRRTVFAGRRRALVEVLITSRAYETTSAGTTERSDSIGTKTSVQTRRTVALVKFYIAMFTLPARSAHTVVAVDSVDACTGWFSKMSSLGSKSVILSHFWVKRVFLAHVGSKKAHFDHFQPVSALFSYV